MTGTPRTCPTCGAMLPQKPASRAPTDAELLPVAEFAETMPSKGQPLEPLGRDSGVSGSSISLLLVALALILVCIGVSIESPGLGILLALVAAPAMIRTLVVHERRQGQGRPLSPAGAIGVFFASFAATIGIGILVVVAIVVAFFIICLAAFQFGSL